MKKLADLTLVINNYGTKLQSYALCRAIKSLNLVEPEVIRLQGSWHGKSVKISRKKQLIDVLKTYKLKSLKKIIDFIRWSYQFKIIRKNADTFKVGSIYSLFGHPNRQNPLICQTTVF